MCGICGELCYENFSSNPPSSPRKREPSDSLRKMVELLKRRGPDGEGFFTQDRVQLGHRRLAIIDLSPRSNQPFFDPELNIAVVFNGTIYNYKELRNQLEAHYTFTSEGDTEVLLKAYHHWREDVVQHLHGVFAFAIWDGQHQSLFLARDRLGVKPLYYSDTKTHLRFSSTLQSLVATGQVDTSLDPTSLHFHFHLHGVVPAPRTILKGVRKLGPAQWLKIEKDGKKVFHRYWNPQGSLNHPPLSEEEWISETRRLLFAAVDRERKASDVEVGLFLSGGLDSSLILAILYELGTHQVQTFSLGVEPWQGYPGDEFEHSNLVAERFQSRHTQFLISNREMLESLPLATQSMSEPMPSTDVTAFYLLSQRVSKKVKVVLSGQGADELFGGYFWYPLMQKESGSAIQRFSKHYFDRSHEDYLKLIEPDFASCEDVTTPYMEAELNWSKNFLDSVFHAEISTLMVDDPIKRVDNMTMTWGLEGRVPLLDYALVEHAMMMPPELKLKSGGKHPLKEIAKTLLPDSIIHRDKGYFPMPSFKYLHEDYLEFVRDLLLSDTAQRRALYQKDYVEKLLQNPNGSFSPIQGNRLWHLALVELWLQQNGL